MRTLIDYAPFYDASKFWIERDRWPAKWINHSQADGTSAVVLAFKRTFSVDKPTTVRVHVAADERYELFLDGQRIGRGPERGDRFNWFFETYDLVFQPGEHTLVARTWWLSTFGPSPMAQITVRSGFILAAEGGEPMRDLLATGYAPWETLRMGGYRWVPPGVTWGTGCKVHLIARDFPFGYERGEGPGWVQPTSIDFGYGPGQLIDQPNLWSLKPATLPAMFERELRVGVARHVQAITEVRDDEQVVLAADHIAPEADAWNAMLRGDAPIVIPPNTLRRVIIDLAEYYCAYTDLVTSGGNGSMVRSWWAESLFEAGSERVKAMYNTRVKGNRDVIEGKTFIGVGDTFEPDGGQHRAMNTLWWEAGRYIELTVRTGAEPLTIERFSLRETGYPYEWTSRFESDDDRLADVIPIAKRVLQMCSHETYMDCPYYEQMMYVGDTRLEVLATYTWTPDNRLPRKAMCIYDESRKTPGFTQSRYPTRVQQTIPPFSAWWIGMVHDFAMWRDDLTFVRSLLPGVRAVLDTFARFKTHDGLVVGPPGWNFMDWVPSWKSGMPIDADHGISAPLNLKLAWIHKQAAELEEIVGDPELAALQRRRADELTTAALGAFWDDRRGLFADDLGHKSYSEHSQCLALLGGLVSGERAAKVQVGLLADDDLARTTIYFTHYLFETYRQIGRIDRLFDRLPLWFDHKTNGLRTTIEMPEPTRSDCHAWGAHPIYHYFASILGIRPASAGFKTVDIHPQLGPLTWAKGSMPHPRGTIGVDLKQDGGKLTGTVDLPDGITGQLRLANPVPLKSGRNHL